jgi:hypothetical protein
LYGLVVEAVEVLILLVALFLPNVVPVSQRSFGDLELMLPCFCALVAIFKKILECCWPALLANIVSRPPAFVGIESG